MGSTQSLEHRAGRRREVERRFEAKRGPACTGAVETGRRRDRGRGRRAERSLRCWHSFPLQPSSLERAKRGLQCWHYLSLKLFLSQL